MLGGTTGPLATVGPPRPPSVFPTALETAAAPESGVDVDGAGATGWGPWRTAGVGCGGGGEGWARGGGEGRRWCGRDGLAPMADGRLGMRRARDDVDRRQRDGANGQWRRWRTGGRRSRVRRRGLRRNRLGVRFSASWREGA